MAIDAGTGSIRAVIFDTLGNQISASQKEWTHLEEPGVANSMSFDFEKNYGDIGADFIEAHHTIPVSEMKENHMTSSEDFILLCSNCHRMIHKKEPWLSKDNLSELFK